MAAGRGHWEVVEALLAGGANVGHRALDNTTALHAAALAGCVRCVRALLAAGGDPQLQCDMQLQYDEVARLVRGRSRTCTGTRRACTALHGCTAARVLHARGELPRGWVCGQVPTGKRERT